MHMIGAHFQEIVSLCDPIWRGLSEDEKKRQVRLIVFMKKLIISNNHESWSEVIKWSNFDLKAIEVFMHLSLPHSILLFSKI